MLFRLIRMVAGLGICISLAAPAQAQYRTEFAAGWGDDQTHMARLGLARDWDQAWFTDGDWQLGGYWLAEIGYWNSDKGHGSNDDLWEVGLTPVLRFEPKSGDVRPYVEAGIGGHVLSDTRIGPRKFSTAWQFGSHIGAGIRCGQFEFGYRFQHLSNGDIKTPNNGINFHMVNASLNF